jgi:hypothetical protein
MAKPKESEVRSQDASGADWPVDLPYTLYFPRRGGYAAADIEYSAPLPRVGDVVEYIDFQGIPRQYKVVDVVHTYQDSPAGTEPEAIRLLRAGLPRVYLALDRRKPRA